MRIEQGSDFSASVAKLDSPEVKGGVLQLRMTLNFVIEQSEPKSSLGWDPDAKEICKDGKCIPIS